MARRKRNGGAEAGEPETESSESEGPPRGGGQPRLRSALTVRYAGLIAVYTLLHGRVPQELQSGLRALPIWLLVGVLYRTRRQYTSSDGLEGLMHLLEEPPGLRMGFVVAQGLALGSLGDVLLEMQGAELEWEVNKDDFFWQGMASFLLAHLFVIGALLSDTPKQATSGVALGSLGAYAAFLIQKLWHFVEAELRALVVMYGVILVMMVYCAIARAAVAPAEDRAGAWAAAIGAFCHLVADSVRAVDKFLHRGQLPGAKIVVMGTYFIGQHMVSLAALSAIERNSGIVRRSPQT